MILNLKVVDRLCKQYCYLYSQLYGKGFNEKLEKEFMECKNSIGLVKELLGVEIETNMGDNLVGVRLVNPKDNKVLGSCSMKVEYKLKPVLSVLFRGNCKEIKDSLYSVCQRVNCSLEEVQLSCDNQYNVLATDSTGFVWDITKAPSVKELFRVIGKDKKPIVTIKMTEYRDALSFAPVRVYVI